LSLLVYAGIGFLGGLGALARFGIDATVSTRARGPFPLGTFLVNISGSLVLGLVIGAAVTGDALALVATGALGAYTTFSTWAFESHRLAEDGELGLSAANFAVSLVAGIAAAALGRLLGGAL
jgi:CrcB protein